MLVKQSFIQPGDGLQGFVSSADNFIRRKYEYGPVGISLKMFPRTTRVLNLFLFDFIVWRIQRLNRYNE